MLCYVMLCYVMLCYVMLCYDIGLLCYVMLCYDIGLLCPQVGKYYYGNCKFYNSLYFKLQLQTLVILTLSQVDNQHGFYVIIRIMLKPCVCAF